MKKNLKRTGLVLVLLFCLLLNTVGCTAGGPSAGVGSQTTESGFDGSLDPSGSYESDTESHPATGSSDKDEKPDDSQKPDSSEEPSESEKPDNSQKPSESEKPDNSQKPSESEKPDNSQKPSGSEKPDNSQKPSESEKPDSSEEPSESEKPDNSQKPEEDKGPTSDPYVGMSKEEFYASYKPATTLADALYRSKHGFLSGSLEVPGQYVTEASYRPTKGDAFVRNTDTYYLDDGNTYVVVDAYGKEVMRIFRGGAYITLEEVAAYMYAFGGSTGSFPANYVSSTKTNSLNNSIWGEYLRLNHSYFTGDTSRYPYEPELPNISGCNGDLQYYEMDIGTTGTVTPGYPNASVYNNGNKITRGAARLVYARQDLNRNGVFEENEVYVFYTHNHYNDFREYLNYYGGWGEVFGNETGGGVFDSKTQCKPTPYVPTAYATFRSRLVLFTNPYSVTEKYRLCA